MKKYFSIKKLIFTIGSVIVIAITAIVVKGLKSKK